MNPKENQQALVITRTFDYPVELVWKAWTDPELVMKWWGPMEFTSPVCKIDLREGGQYLFCMRAPESHGGHDFYSTGFYKKIVPMERLEFTQSLSDKDGNVLDPAQIGMPPEFPKDVHFIIEFKAQGSSRTELTITEYGWTVLGPMSDNAVAGMNQSLDKLAQAIA
ncbi:Activator of Hsp90 ATPase homolog 1-like protein [Chlamydia abortus]|nr:Activator of Hsp90 ATPase homolog 1-like protein [Chlamydia abortus]